MVVRPDADQEHALEFRGVHLVVVAPPGTGKTSLAVRLAGREGETLESHQQVLLLTFSNQARSQLEREADAQLGPSLRRRVVVSNYHRLFWTTVKAYARLLGLPVSYRVTSGAKRRAVVLGASPAARRIPKPLLESAAEFRDPRFRPDVALSEAELEAILGAISREYAAGRLVFEDFGALWWRLMDSSPTLRTALRARFPTIIADEHQDASSVQDAVVRSLATKMVIFADPLQLIHAWRGADEARLGAHLTEADEVIELRTPHRWHGSPEIGQWLLDFRARLIGEVRPGDRPRTARVTLTDPTRGINGQIAETRFAVLRALAGGATSIAVMASRNDDISRVRSHLSRNGLSPTHLGINHAFDELVELVDDLPRATPAETAARIIAVLAGLTPNLQEAAAQATARLQPEGTRKTGCSLAARMVLEAADLGYDLGAAGFFPGVAKGLASIRQAGMHVPAQDVARLYAAASLETDLESQLTVFQTRLAAASHQAARRDHGVLTMTVHASKGREFDHVVLFDATAASFDPADEERRRLFYVAITRARSGWDIIAPHTLETPLIHLLGS